ncbi:hypothetical protein DYE48_15450 [Halobacillus trueperi]|uniref:Uncharacterized protein n=2 Tax=Halobacillus trueperi TaxID=156205 RepID=A0A3E0J4H2_9BACI|nr:hypothetical protein DYE48_15450 [Halobacillus trueperi]
MLKVIGVIGLLVLMVRYFSSFIVVSGAILVLLISIGFVGGIFETVSDFIKGDNRNYRDSEERYGDYEEGYTDDDNTHHVDPHYVEGYERSDGTFTYS